MRLWDVRTGGLNATLEGHTSDIRALAFSPDSEDASGTTLVSASEDNVLHFWDTRTEEFRTPLTGWTEGFTTMALSPDGTTIASGGSWQGNFIRLWDPHTGELQAVLEDTPIQSRLRHSRRMGKPSSVQIGMA